MSVMSFVPTPVNYLCEIGTNNSMLIQIYKELSTYIFFENFTSNNSSIYLLTSANQIQVIYISTQIYFKMYGS